MAQLFKLRFYVLQEIVDTFTNKWDKYVKMFLYFV